MSAHLGRRFLRPRYVFFTAAHLWVVDERQPVAALIDPHTESLAGLVAWTDLPPALPGSGPVQIAADESGLWIQNHRDGPLVHVGIDGIDRSEYTEGHHLIAAGRGGAWCMTPPRRHNDIAPSPDIPPRTLRRKPTLLVSKPGGGMRRVEVDTAAMVSAEFDESSLYLGVEHDPWERVPRVDSAGGKRPGFELRYSSSVLQIPLHDPAPLRIDRNTYLCAEDRQVGYTSEYADKYYNENHYRKRAFDGNVRWYWGKDPIARGATTVRAYRGEDSSPVTTLLLPGMDVAHGVAGAGRLWLVARTATRPAVGRSVLSAGVDGGIHSLITGGIDITDRCWPVGPEPLDHHGYVQYCLRSLDRMRFSDKVDQVSAAYVGHWPSGRIHVRFRHRDYPGLVLTARLNLYDEQGVRLDNLLSYASAELGEQADTRAYPPASEAIEGVLHV
ncbi:hypothetical protein GEO20_23800 [Rhodococcus erythropolis]|uniref:hypothetical protein n=1 Tax=Rhodococcus erythropolis TaxID=1833 RepID=UPI0012922F9E|nr:hypothetical protein [Rhodococcus erythropolis]MQP34968.1 hypothetical protein [Rhodococcus erythropolis]